MKFYTGIICCRFEDHVAERKKVIVAASKRESAEKRLKRILFEEFSKPWFFLGGVYGPFNSEEEAKGPFLQLQ